VTRALALLRNDVRLQVRYGLYGVSLVMVLVWGVILGILSRGVALPASLLVAPFVTINLIITTFYFMAALLLFEKSEGVLTAIVTTPVTAVQFLMSKGVTLAFLAAAETLLIVAFVFGTATITPSLAVASLLLAFFYAMSGFIVVVRFESITKFLLPSVPAVMLLLVPLVTNVVVHPVQPFVLLMRGAGWLALLAAIFWCGVALLVARREFQRFVVRA
jgi:fluoroquinolone transport system permease protein